MQNVMKLSEANLRKKEYIITEIGKEIVKNEIERLHELIKNGEEIIGREYRRNVQILEETGVEYIGSVLCWAYSRNIVKKVLVNMYRILIIEDDMTIAKAIKNFLCKWNYEAEYIEDFKEVTAQFIKFDPQIVLLDISLPFYNGYHWCSEIRKISKVPIIFISSMADSMNIIMAVNMGGDDFITKPFDLNILVAKVQAMIRRAYSFGGKLEVIEHKGVVLNISNATLEYENNKIELTKNEFKILQILLENVGKAIPREVIMTRLWESDSYIDDNTLTVNVTRLRKRLSDAGISDFIKTKKGIGYVVE